MDMSDAPREKRINIYYDLLNSINQFTPDRLSMCHVSARGRALVILRRIAVNPVVSCYHCGRLIMLRRVGHVSREKVFIVDARLPDTITSVARYHLFAFRCYFVTSKYRRYLDCIRKYCSDKSDIFLSADKCIYAYK